MKNLVENQSNKKFLKVQEELKRLLSIVMYTINEESEEQEFDYYINSGNKEDIKIAQYLKEDTLQRDEKIKNGNYLSQTISKSNNKQKNEPKTRVNKIEPIMQNTQTKKKNIILSKNNDGFDRE